MNLDGVDAKEEIFAKVSSLRFFWQVGVGCRQDTHIDATCLRGADALKFAGFKNPQKFSLLAKWDIGNFIEKQRTAFGLFKTSDAI